MELGHPAFFQSRSVARLSWKTLTGCGTREVCCCIQNRLALEYPSFSTFRLPTTRPTVSLSQTKKKIRLSRRQAPAGKATEAQNVRQLGGSRDSWRDDYRLQHPASRSPAAARPISSGS